MKENQPKKVNEFVTVFGSTGSGKTYLISTTILKHYKRLIIFDTMNEYEHEQEILVSSVENFQETIETLHKHETQEFRIRIVSRHIQDYFDVLAVVVDNEFRGITLVIDEIDKFGNPTSIEKPLYDIYNVGRHFEIDVISASRRPNQVHRIITSQSHLLVLFHTSEPRDLAYLREYANRDISNKVKELGNYEYVCYGSEEIQKKLGLNPKNA